MKLKTYAIYTVVFCVGLIVAKLGFDLLSPSPKQRLAQAVSPIVSNVASQQKITPSAPSTPRAKVIQDTLPASNFVLNGIFFSGGSTYALVNNKIVQPGDSIDGAQVLSISAETVELKLGDSTITLRTVH